jgi:hypothetical protein
MTEPVFFPARQPDLSEHPARSGLRLLRRRDQRVVDDHRRPMTA